MNFNVALLQISPAGDDLTKNLTIGLDACRRAKSAGADLALFPELWNIGGALPVLDRQRWINSAITQDSAFVRAFSEAARDLNLNIAITYLEQHQHLPRNSVSILNGKGDLALHYSKVFICNFGLDELSKNRPNQKEIGCDVNCSPGDSFDTAVLNGSQGEVTVGAMICSDREFPEPAAQLTLNGAELIIVPNACTWDEIRTAGLKTRAFENLVAVAMVNYPLPLSNGNSQAHTCVPWQNGKPRDTTIAQAGEQEEILIATFDMNAIRSFRKAESWRLDYLRSASAH